MLNTFKYRLLYCASIVLLFFFYTEAQATHNKAGELTYRTVSQNTIEATLYTYSDQRSSVDRQEVVIEWGDNTTDTVRREQQTNLGDNINENRYVAKHTYPGSGTYKITFTDPNRIEGINNIANSVNTQFHIESEIRLDPVRGGNNSVQLLRRPIDFAKVGETFKHNPNAWDPDGDSLHFELITPLQDKDEPVRGYFHPPASNSFDLNNQTGELVWDAPTQTGVYDVAILITEYRNGVKMGSVIRDMHIIVEDTDNNPPVIEAIADTCVNAGDSPVLDFEVFASDPDEGDRITLDASGGPFETPVEPAATFSPDPASGIDETSGTFHWEPACSHISRYPYQVVFKAVDDHNRTPLHDKETFHIEVYGPEPQNLSAVPVGDRIELDWDTPVCNNAVGYVIYRRNQESGWDPGQCEPGIPGHTGFQAIDTVEGFDNTEYLDDDHGAGLIPGINYCYRITALYYGEGQLTIAEGLASDEVCEELVKDLPVLTHADVVDTDNNNGSVYVEWSKATELDTQQHPGPYRYELHHSAGSLQPGEMTEITSFSADEFYQLNDTAFTHENINTRDLPHVYEVKLFATVDNEDFEVGSAREASTVYLNSEAGHEMISLSWDYNQPWRNDSFVVYRLNDTTGAFDSLHMTASTTYEDTGLTKGETYCYYVKAYGSYGMKGFNEPFINRSQIVCENAVDTIPPCPPILDASANCDRKVNDLKWHFDFQDDAHCSDDVAAYNFYFRPSREGEFERVSGRNGYQPTDYTDNRSELRESLAGCYRITALNEYGYESEMSNEVCVDNCPVYKLPNVFSPTGDKINDVFRPLEESRFVDEVDFRVYNRWGRLVFQTNDPDINWDGTDQESGEPLEAGTYYYKCKVYELFLDGRESYMINGSVNIMR